MEQSNQNRTGERTGDISILIFRARERFEEPLHPARAVPDSYRSLDNRIRELCRQVVEAKDQLQPTLEELRSALREHTQRLRNLAARQLLGSMRGRRFSEQ
jgi:hypothetical protein